ncbi:DUF4097 family beta strand repeat-containing protein [Acidicapsa ligni]|uniref:DUF4097 family beta strand repeat-containing protein n=1 Tax=Acidicapsa ligni TaxID=542300 RepID=UPI0021E0B42D|nr:DUF4097 domain-containing protein [Acidicapsa ligni]
MKHWIPATAVLLALVPGVLSRSAQASEATFERTLTVNGHVILHVSTGSGNIHLTTSSGNQVHVVGHIHSHGDQEDRVRQIAANPPIEQTGDILRVGAHLDNLHNISIDYEITAPANALLEASSGSGDVVDAGVGVDAKLNTGSGNIHATGLQQSISVETGSGDIYAEQTGSGDVKANTGSGNIELRNVSGGLRAQTGSGDIKLGGQPKAGWHVTTGSGSVELWASNAPMNLEASTGSGDIHTDGVTMDAVMTNHHNLTAKLHGGGPAVRIETGSGDIRIH